MSLISLDLDLNVGSSSKKSLYKVLAISSVAPRLSILKVVDFDKLSPEEQVQSSLITVDDTRVVEVWIQHDGPLDPINDLINLPKKFSTMEVCMLSGDTLKLCEELRNESSSTNE